MKAKREGLKKQLKTHEAELSRLEAKEQEKGRKEKELEEVRRSIAQKQQELKELQSVSMVDFLSTWTEAAQSLGVKIEQIRFGEEGEEKSQASLTQAPGQPLTTAIVLKGRFQDLFRLFSLLDTHQKVPFIKALSLSPSEKGFPSLLLDLTVELRTK